ncbi:hypothetical protein LTR62_001514 [Meristemomyces frigidus]|uniref:Hemerythrin-like domain-containing protein n=1 Tax=Meristemomyces frigidus TaxID=1508187 RepID=A0AAN7YQK7_9PEZI|nr:hypothetical protein LTR62_001514 [Meristemomyces frigidus]
MAHPWADQPYTLIQMKAFSQDSSHSANYVATQMALAHNGILRGLNSIYLQCTNIPPKDLVSIKDFLTYCQCWSESMHHHHDAEESTFFPTIEKVAGTPGLMAQNVEQHAAFTPGFEAFHEYARTCNAKEYDGQKMRGLVEAFAEPLRKHLHEEIETLRDLREYDSETVRQAYKQLEKILMDTDSFRIAPLVFGTADRHYEGGIHNFPPVPFFVPSVIYYVFGFRYRGAWRFNPCTMWRDRKELAFPEKLKASA